jgi:succinate dehydrogenase/fumarate reductase flavoprotein subunit
MAYRAGAVLRGMEFVQFHPTVLYVAGMSRILVSETARGEGAVLRDRHGHRFMPEYHKDAELAPRDVVSRSIVAQLAKVHDTHVYLDMRHLPADRVRTRFPLIYKACLEFGIDITRDLIPVHPACHYMVGGVETDDDGRTLAGGPVRGGEVASTGFHGATACGQQTLAARGRGDGHQGRGAAAGAAGGHARRRRGLPARSVAGDGPAGLDNALVRSRCGGSSVHRARRPRPRAGGAVSCDRHHLVSQRLGDPQGWCW